MTAQPLRSETPNVNVIYNPATGDRVGSVRRTETAKVAAVVERARQAQVRWAQRSFDDRAAILRRFHDRILDHSDPFLDTIQGETGKARRDALSEVLTVAGTARYYLTRGKELLSERSAQGAVPGLTTARVAHLPLGVVGLITPWNFPFLLVAGDGLPALLAGNALVVKPDEKTPLSAEGFRTAMIDCGLDPDLIQLVHGDGPTVGQELIQQVDYIGFTGSTEVGRKVAVAAAERLIPFSLELGGKNPMIVLADASLDDAAKGLMTGAFANGGQTCISVERVFVERPVFDDFVAQAIEETENLAVGYSTDWSTDVGSLISSEHADKVFAHIEDAVGKGARVLTGGRRLSDRGPAFVAPTLLTGVDESMDLFAEETFGPVVAIEPVDSVDEAVERANRSRYGLNASVWSGSSERGFEIARRLEVGSAGINSTLLIYNTFDVPMGGVKDSGLGRRHGAHGLLRYTREESLVGSFASGGGYEAILGQLTSDRMAETATSAFKFLRRIPFLR